jgi:hypothetical protein
VPPDNPDCRGKLCSPEERIDIPYFTFYPAERITERGRTKTYSSFEKGRVDPCADEDFKPRVVATGMVALVIHTFRWDRYEREEAMRKYLSGTCCQYLEGTHDSVPWHNKSRLTDRVFAEIYAWHIMEERARINQSEGIYEYFTKTEQEAIRQRVKEAVEYVGTYFSSALQHIELSFDDLAEYFPQFVRRTKALADKCVSAGFLVDSPGANLAPGMVWWVDSEIKASMYRAALLNDTCTAPRTIMLKEIGDNVPGIGQEIVDNMRLYRRLYETYKDSFRQLAGHKDISNIGNRLGELDEACGMVLSTLERYYGIPPETQEAQPQQKEATKRGRNKGGTFADCIIATGEERGRLLARFHQLIDGHKGRRVALVVTIAIEQRLIHKPTFPQLQDEFGEIGVKSGYASQMRDRSFTDEERGSIVFS